MSIGLPRKRVRVVTLRSLADIPEGVAPKRTAMAGGYVGLRWRIGRHHYLFAYEHRVVVGRLDPGVVVHHRNGIKSDNRLENLEVVESQSIHCRMHNPVKFDIEEAKRLYAEGLGCKRIGRLLGADGPRVSRALRKAGVETRSSGPLTHCRRGHLFTETTTMRRRDGKECRVCRRQNERARRAAAKTATGAR